MSNSESADLFVISRGAAFICFFLRCFICDLLVGSPPTQPDRASIAELTVSCSFSRSSMSFIIGGRKLRSMDMLESSQSDAAVSCLCGAMPPVLSLIEDMYIPMSSFALLIVSVIDCTSFSSRVKSSAKHLTSNDFWAPTISITPDSSSFALSRSMALSAAPKVESLPSHPPMIAPIESTCCCRVAFWVRRNTSSLATEGGSARPSSITRSDSSMLTCALFTMVDAREAKRSVFNVSSKFTSAGEAQASMTVRPFPPRLSLSSRVILESR